jgi:hypothetical protein
MARLAAGCHPGAVTPSADPSPPRRPIFFPVVIATVFFTIIGMTAGFLLGERHRRMTRAAAETQQTPEATDSAAPVPTGKPCPDEALATATRLGLSADLREVFHVVTDHDNVVWICADPDNRLYYQGKTGGVDAPLVEGDNGLFLSGVIKQGADEYEVIAPNDHNRIEVNRKQLIIHRTDGRNQVQNVIGD